MKKQTKSVNCLSKILLLVISIKAHKSNTVYCFPTEKYLLTGDTFGKLTFDKLEM